ncbi:hypothetical protein GSF12_04950 [Moraxella osloensis]|uniref:HNH endonuclease n=1 Tax=Faucicola osloensis TaxID=34062 RepID=A0A6P1KCH7_FAUOS|nr:hypothetical protein [Moraxella osloensis]QHG09286.1 hypothetical protein GSF12_04950 [Moraxella osloensis]
MYQYLPNVCYYCGIKLQPNTLTKEHVPPKVFFPNTDRDNLITVPSCHLHNSGKSNDDEYLFQMLSIQILANEKGQNLGTEKGVASIRRNRKFMKELAKNASVVYVDEEKNGKLKPTFAFNIDDTRISNSIQAIARALYFFEFNKVFLGKITDYNASLISLDENNSIEINQSLENTRKVIERNFNHVEKKGSNQEIFYYQFLEVYPYLGFSYALKLCFYEGINFVVLFRENLKTKIKPLIISLHKML